LNAPLIHNIPIGLIIAGPIVAFVISIFVLLRSTLSTLQEALKHRSIGTVLFAFVCLIFSLLVPIGISTVIVDGWSSLMLFFMALILGLSLFVSGVKGLKMLRAHQFMPILFVLLIDILVPTSLIIYQTNMLQGLVSSLLVVVSLSQFIPYLPVGALVLLVADVSLDKKSMRTIRGIGIVVALFVAIEFVVVVIWDISCLIAGNGSDGLGILLVSSIILISMLVLVVIALLRAFTIASQPERTEIVLEQMPKY
jgi:cytochrome bd-type quinol oxidase subunit 2